MTRSQLIEGIQWRLLILSNNMEESDLVCFDTNKLIALFDKLDKQCDNLDKRLNKQLAFYD